VLTVSIGCAYELAGNCSEAIGVQMLRSEKCVCRQTHEREELAKIGVGQSVCIGGGRSVPQPSTLKGGKKEPYERESQRRSNCRKGGEVLREGKKI